MDNLDITQVIKSVEEFITTLQRTFASEGWGDYSKTEKSMGHILMGETHVLEKMCDPLLEKILEDADVDMSVRLAALKCVGEMFTVFVPNKGFPDKMVKHENGSVYSIIPEEFSNFIMQNYLEQLHLMQKVWLVAHNNPTKTVKQKM